MLHRIARLAIAAPRRVLFVAAMLAAGAAVFGVPVANFLSAGGFDDPSSESSRADGLLADRFHQGDMKVLIAVTAIGGAQGDGARAVGTDIVGKLEQSPHVADVTSPWTSPPEVAGPLISRDGKTGLIVAVMSGGENDAQKYAKALVDDVVHDRDGVTVRAGGTAMVYSQITAQTERDLLTMESIAIPLSFLVLVWVFGGLLAAMLPMIVGLMAILGSMAVLRLITFATDVSIFGLNLATALGLALAIDYTLLIVSRYRDEIAGGSEPEPALIQTM